MGPEVWFAVAKWAKQTDSLFKAQRSIACSIGRILGHEETPSIKQANSGRKIIIRARELGFSHPMLKTELITALNDPRLDEFE